MFAKVLPSKYMNFHITQTPDVCYRKEIKSNGRRERANITILSARGALYLQELHTFLTLICKFCKLSALERWKWFINDTHNSGQIFILLLSHYYTHRDDGNWSEASWGNVILFHKKKTEWMRSARDLGRRERSLGVKGVPFSW